MTNRREILQIGLAAAAWPLGVGAPPVAVAGPLASRAEPLTLYKALYDVRFAASVAFAERLAGRGVAVVAMAGDMTRFWYDDLYHRWKAGPAAIAGLTGYGALFCLEQLAWAERSRVVFRAQHAPVAEGCVRHAIEGPAALVGGVERLAAAPDWAAAMADAVSACPRGREVEAKAQALTALASVPMPGEEPLFTWVIAPVVRS